MTAWIGGSQTSDMAFVMIMPTGRWPGDPAPGMLDLIDALHMRPGQMTSAVPHLSVELTGDHVSVCKRAQPLAECPVTAAWSATARRDHRVILVVGTAPFTGDLNAYLTDHADTCALAFVTVATLPERPDPAGVLA